MIIITAPHFVAAVILDPRARIVIRAAPILRYMLGWTEERVVDYLKFKGWYNYRTIG